MSSGTSCAALVASLFHFGKYTVGEAKDHLAARGQPVRAAPDA